MSYIEPAQDLSNPVPRVRRTGHFQRPASTSFQRTPYQNKRRSQNIEPSTNVFISYIPPDFTEQDLRNLCSQYGEIICSKIMINLQTGQSKCFGFVKFKDLSQATAAIKGINGMQVRNKKLLAKYAESQEKKETVSRMLFIKRIPIFVDTNTVISLFSRFGDILSVSPCHKIEGPEQKYWGCFIQYPSIQSATAAIDEMNNQIIAPGTMPIHVTYADESRHIGQYFTPPPPVATPDFAVQEPRNLLPSFFFN